MATPDDRHSIVITKQMTYRGATRQFSNRYHFEGDLPADPAHWTTLADNIVLAEKAIFYSGVTIIAATGYDAGTATSTNPHGDAVFNKTYTTAGTFVQDATDVLCPGDCVGLVRYSTPARSSRNHPVYLFNYYHSVFRDSTSADVVSNTQVSAYDTYATHWVSGFSDGAETRERCGPHGAVAVGHHTDTAVRHRDFPN